MSINLFYLKEVFKNFEARDEIYKNLIHFLKKEFYFIIIIIYRTLQCAMSRDDITIKVKKSVGSRFLDFKFDIKKNFI